MSDRWYSRPVLFVANLERALAFYIDKLGFRENWRHVEEGEMLVAQVDRTGCELILSSQWADKVGSGLMFISLDRSAFAAARAEFQGRGVAVREGWWGYRVMIVEDPDLNQLYFPFPSEEAQP